MTPPSTRAAADAVIDAEVTSPDVLVIDGMFCSACAAGIEAALQRLPGVRHAAVSFAADAAVIEWQSQARDSAALVEAVTNLGYSSRLLDGEQPAAAKATSASDPARNLQLRLAVAVFFGMWMMFPTLGLYLGSSDDAGVNRGLAIAAMVAGLPVVLYSGYPFYRMGVLTLRGGIPGVDALVSLGVLASVSLSLYFLWLDRADVYIEVAVSLITFQLIARLVDVRIRRKAQDAVLQLLELSPSKVAIVDPQGTVQSVPLNAVKNDSTAFVYAGQRVAVDGEVIEGTASVDRSLVTGETAPVLLAADDTVIAGERLLDGHLMIRVTGSAGSRRIDELAHLVRTTLATKPAWQKKSDAIARSFLWIAGAAAILGACIALTTGATGAAAAERALAVFVIACPCALSLATPLAGLVAAAAAARRRFVLRDLASITSAQAPTLILLDKTGTLTSGQPQVVQVHSCAADLNRDGVLALAAQAEQGSEHPMARAIVEAAGVPAGVVTLNDSRTSVTPGAGVTLEKQGLRLQVGSARWLSSFGYSLPDLVDTDASRVWVVRNGLVVGAIDLRDELRPGVDQALNDLRSRGIDLKMVSGDRVPAVGRLASRLGIEAIAEMTPEQKVAEVARAQAEGKTVVFVGDGVNDGPALAAADLGVAVSNATEVAATASGVNVLDGGVERLPELLALIEQARRVARRNIIFALAYNAIALPFALAGLVQPAVAAMAMAISSLTVMGNSATLYRRQRQMRQRQMKD